MFFSNKLAALVFLGGQFLAQLLYSKWQLQYLWAETVRCEFFQRWTCVAYTKMYNTSWLPLTADNRSQNILNVFISIYKACTLATGDRRQRDASALKLALHLNRAGLGFPCVSHLIIIASDDQLMWKLISGIFFSPHLTSLVLCCSYPELQPITREQSRSHSSLLSRGCEIFGNDFFSGHFFLHEYFFSPPK